MGSQRVKGGFALGLAALTIFIIASCAVRVPKVKFADAPPLPADAHTAPMSLGQVTYRLPTGAETGSVGQGWCLLKTPLGRRDLKSSLNAKDMKDTFHDTLQGEGYDVTGSPDLVFDEDIEADMLRSEYKIAAEIIDARTDACFDKGESALLFPERGGFSGKLYIKVRWHVFDSLRRVSVYRVDTEGYAERALANPEGISLLMDDAFEMASHNLGADAAFRDLFVHGTRPPQLLQENVLPLRPRRFDPAEATVIQKLPLSHAPFTDHADAWRKVTVLIEGGYGHASGFFIDPRGYILTNAHVTGDALHVRIVMADRGEALVGEVIRKDAARDVALVRLMDMPSQRSIDGSPQILPLRTDWPGVGEKVYVIGAPRNPRLQDSVTSGIVSAWRKNYALLGAREDFIQSDVTVQPGNSGGPMLDQFGNIVGLTDAGEQSGLGDSVGLNYFIPIGEALTALQIDMK